jgi:hypothetical protein
MLDVDLFGVSPVGHHFTNILLHAANVVLLFLLLHRMTAQTGPCAFAAALFAVHPLHVESVAWIAERKDVLSLFFGLLSLHAYVRYASQSQPRAYSWLIVTFALALLSKPMLVTLPAAMLLLDYWPLARLNGRETWWPRIREKLPLLALSSATCVATVLAQRSAGAVRTLEAYPLPHRVANAAISTVAYLAKTVWPTDLSIFYPYPASFSPLAVAGAVALLVVISAVVIVLVWRVPYLFVGWFWFLGTLVPVIGIVQVGRQSMADRYTYLPHIGLFMAIAWGLADAARTLKLPRPAVSIAGSAVVVVLAVVTIAQLGHWQNSMTLFAHALSIDPTNYLAHHQLANELARRGDQELQAAEIHYRAALESFPEHPRSHLNLARVLARRGRYAEAEASIETALRLDPTLPTARETLAEIRRRLRMTSPPSTSPSP